MQSQKCHQSNAEDDRQEQKIEGGTAQGSRNDQHDKTDLFRFFDRSTETNDRQSPEQTQREGQGKLDGDEDGGYRGPKQRKCPVNETSG